MSFLNKIARVIVNSITLMLITAFCSLYATANPHPNLVINLNDVANMRIALKKEGLFKSTYIAKRKAVDAQISQPILVPLPINSGGGYTHEQHKKNYKVMYEAGIIFQLSQDKKYALYVRDMLLKYADMYPKLPLHPKRKKGKKNPGKLFWQSLNEAMWLVYTSQAYDSVMPALNGTEREKIETNLFRPMVKFLSEDSPSTFNKVHNHGTWLTAAVGMTGFVLGELDWVEKSLYGLDKSGNGGFLKQLDELFSPQGYYSEGPYYQRYALLPFITFAKAIQNNQPERKIFEYRNGIILKAIDTTIQLSYNKLFFPINDAIKSKGTDTIELVHGIALAYSITGDTDLLDIAKSQKNIVLTGDGLKVAQALDKQQETKYQFKSIAFGDGKDGKQGALVIMRQDVETQQALLFKASGQGMGHGHFDKLTWQFYDKGEEIVSDYGAARFLNVEAKSGGGYLPENKSWAKQTIAHNTIVVDEQSHFNAKVKVGILHNPELLFFEKSDNVIMSSARINTVYQGVSLTRTVALLNFPETKQSLTVDIFKVDSNEQHQYDLPTHFKGHLIDTNFPLNSQLTKMTTLGEEHGYQHLWVQAQAKPMSGLAKVTWLNTNGRFYTQSSIMDGDTELIFTELGANDPFFNLRNEKAFIKRKTHAKKHTFVSVLEPHGEYNPAIEFTIDAVSKVKQLKYHQHNNIEMLEIVFSSNKQYLLAFNPSKNIVKDQINHFSFMNKNYQFSGQIKLINLSN